MLLGRDEKYERAIDEAWAAIQRGDIERARTLVRELPEDQRRAAARVLVERRNNTSFALAPGDPDLVLDLFDRAHVEAMSRIGDYVRGTLPVRRTR